MIYNSLNIIDIQRDIKCVKCNNINSGRPAIFVNIVSLSLRVSMTAIVSELSRVERLEGAGIVGFVGNRLPLLGES